MLSKFFGVFDILNNSKKKSLKIFLKADPSSTIGKTDVHKQVIEIYPVQRKSSLINMSISMFYQISSVILYLLLYIDWQRLRKTSRQTDEGVKDQDIRRIVSKDVAHLKRPSLVSEIHLALSDF